LLIVIPTISELSQFRKAYSKRSDTLAWKWDIGLESSPSCGGWRRTVSWVPTALKRLYCLYFLLYGKYLKFCLIHDYSVEQFATISHHRDLYLTTHDTQNRQIFMPPMGFEATISAGERARNFVKHIRAHLPTGPARPRPTTLLPPRSKVQPEAVNAVVSS
jgi:hypothetical protein